MGLLRAGAPKGTNTVLLFICHIKIKKKYLELSLSVSVHLLNLINIIT